MSKLGKPTTRVLSGMRPTGALHLGNYYGALKNWVSLQHEYECYFFVADWHALTTQYEDTESIIEMTHEVVIDWLVAGLDPSLCSMFVQSQIPEHAELTLLLGMGTPLAWLERVPSYKDQQDKLNDRDLATYGFLGYPLMQAADILIYRPSYVPVGEDQVPHIELTREIARRFNYLYGRESGYEEKAELAIKKMGKKNAKFYRELKRKYQEQGDDEALAVAQAFLDDQQNITIGDKERLYGFLEGGGKVILPEPEALLTQSAKISGLDGQKMSKSYGNTIQMRENPDRIDLKIRKMPTDPARVRRDDPGNPELCPVFDLHKVYSSSETKEWVISGCRSAGIGCLDCKKPLIDQICSEVSDFREKAKPFINDPDLVKDILISGNEAARDIAAQTMDDVREYMGLPGR